LDGDKPIRSWQKGSSEARRGVKAEIERGYSGAIWQSAGRREFMNVIELEEIAAKQKRPEASFDAAQKNKRKCQCCIKKQPS
jgi:hypothetical protein